MITGRIFFKTNQNPPNLISLTLKLNKLRSFFKSYSPKKRKLKSPNFKNEIESYCNVFICSFTFINRK